MSKHSGGYNIWRDEDLKKTFDALDSALDKVDELQKEIENKDEEISELKYQKEKEKKKMSKHNTTLIIIGIIALAVVTFLSIVKCADNKANVLWPEGRVMPR